MKFRIRPATILGLSLLALASTVFPQPAAAVAKWQWLQVPTPGNVPIASVAVAPNDVPFVQTRAGGAVFYLKRGNLQTPDQWLYLEGALSRFRLSADLDGTIWALDDKGVPWQPSGIKDPNFHPEPGWGWRKALGWEGRCVRAMAPSGVGPDATEAFMTPESRSWDRHDWAIGCGGDDDGSLWVIQRINDRGSFSTSGWKQIAKGQGATSARVAVFTHYAPFGAVQDVWFQDSLASGGGTWIYDQDNDKVVNVPNPLTRDSAKPSPPRTVGTALTAHYARFKNPSANSNKGWVYRWDDDTQAWVYVVGDPSSSVYIDQIAHSEAYASKIGWIPASRVWATDNLGQLYYLFNAEEPI